jgi:hypothetical protein
MAMGIKEFVQKQNNINLTIESVTAGQSDQLKKSIR